jgi:hypothetical protein
MQIKVQLPIIVNVDNVGAIFMTENVTATSRTRHVDARYHYVREFVAEGFLNIIFVKSADNRSDMFTKNVSADVLGFHVKSYVVDRSEIITGD